MAYDEGLATRVREELGDRPGLAEKRMFGGLAFLLGGNMACGVRADDLIVRVAADDAETAMGEPGARPFDLTGRPMKGWLLVDANGHAEDEDLRRWVDRGLAYASSLPPKQPRQPPLSHPCRALSLGRVSWSLSRPGGAGKGVLGSPDVVGEPSVQRDQGASGPHADGQDRFDVDALVGGFVAMDEPGYEQEAPGRTTAGNARLAACAVRRAKKPLSARDVSPQGRRPGPDAGC